MDKLPVECNCTFFTTLSHATTIIVPTDMILKTAVNSFLLELVRYIHVPQWPLTHWLYPMQLQLSEIMRLWNMHKRVRKYPVSNIIFVQFLKLLCSSIRLSAKATELCWFVVSCSLNFLLI